MTAFHRRFGLLHTARPLLDLAARPLQTISPPAPEARPPLSSSSRSSSPCAYSRWLASWFRPMPHSPTLPSLLLHKVPTLVQICSPTPSDAAAETNSPSESPASAFPATPCNPLAADRLALSVVTNKSPDSSYTATVSSSFADQMADIPAPPDIGSSSLSDPIAPAPGSGSRAPNHLSSPCPLASPGTSPLVRDSILGTSLPCLPFQSLLCPCRVPLLGQAPRTGGVAAHQENAAKPPLKAQ